MTENVLFRIPRLQKKKKKEAELKALKSGKSLSELIRELLNVIIL